MKEKILAFLDSPVGVKKGDIFVWGLILSFVVFILTTLFWGIGPQTSVIDPYEIEIVGVDTTNGEVTISIGGELYSYTYYK